MNNTFNKTCLLLLLLTLFSCNRKKHHLARVTVSMLFDISDTNRIIPDPNSLLSLYNFKENICHAVTFRKSYISDIENTGEEEFSLEDRIIEEKAGNYYDDPNFRKKQIVSFQQDIANALANISLYKYSEKPETKCFEKVCMELNKLKKCPGTEKYLIISSDMIEHSNIYNGYNSELYETLNLDEKKGMEMILDEFDDDDLPSNLKGISVYILFEPKTTNEDMLFKAFTAVYQKLLEERGASVFIKSSNIIKKYNHE